MKHKVLSMFPISTHLYVTILVVVYLIGLVLRRPLCFVYPTIFMSVVIYFSVPDPEVDRPVLEFVLRLLVACGLIAPLVLIQILRTPG